MFKRINLLKGKATIRLRHLQILCYEHRCTLHNLSYRDDFNDIITTCLLQLLLQHSTQQLSISVFILLEKLFVFLFRCKNCLYICIPSGSALPNLLLDWIVRFSYFIYIVCTVNCRYKMRYAVNVVAQYFFSKSVSLVIS